MSTNFLYIIEPYILGKMIDGIICQNYYWTLIFIITNLFFIAFGYIRRVYDTKVFSKIYNKVVLDFISRQINNIDTSKIVTITEMSRVIIDFLENDVPHFIYLVFVTMGSLIAIYTMSQMSALIILMLIIPTTFVIRYFYIKVQKND